MRGILGEEEWKREVAMVREALEKIDAPHWKEFLAAWPSE
jgi:hypothetical protein